VYPAEEFIDATTVKMNKNGKILLFMVSFLGRGIVVSYISQQDEPEINSQSFGIRYNDKFSRTKNFNAIGK
jgi:hypothetical protein